MTLLTLIPALFFTFIPPLPHSLALLILLLTLCAPTARRRFQNTLRAAGITALLTVLLIALLALLSLILLIFLLTIPLFILCAAIRVLLSPDEIFRHLELIDEDEQDRPGHLAQLRHIERVGNEPLARALAHYRRGMVRVDFERHVEGLAQEVGDLFERLDELQDEGPGEEGLLDVAQLAYHLTMAVRVAACRDAGWAGGLLRVVGWLRLVLGVDQVLYDAAWLASLPEALGWSLRLLCPLVMIWGLWCAEGRPTTLDIWGPLLDLAYFAAIDA